MNNKNLLKIVSVIGLLLVFITGLVAYQYRGVLRNLFSGAALPATCAPRYSIATIGKDATFTASDGDGINYNWAVWQKSEIGKPGATPEATGTGKTFTHAFKTLSSYGVIVNGNALGACGVDVIQQHPDGVDIDFHHIELGNAPDVYYRNGPLYAPCFAPVKTVLGQTFSLDSGYHFNLNNEGNLTATNLSVTVTATAGMHLLDAGKVIVSAGQFVKNSGLDADGNETGVWSFASLAPGTHQSIRFKNDAVVAQLFSIHLSASSQEFDYDQNAGDGRASSTCDSFLDQPLSDSGPIADPPVTDPLNPPAPNKCITDKSVSLGPVGVSANMFGNEVLFHVPDTLPQGYNCVTFRLRKYQLPASGQAYPFSGQTLLEEKTASYGPGWHSMSVAAPLPCSYQTDFYLGLGGNAGLLAWDIQEYGCGGTPAPKVLTCAPANQTIVVGNNATFTASGGDPSTYAWDTTGDNPIIAPTGATATFNFNRVGNFTVSVHAQGYTSGTCAITVTDTTQTPAASISCAPTSQTIAVNQKASFKGTVTGVSGIVAPIITWSAPGGSPASGVAPDFSTAYTASGTYNVTANSSGLAPATCSVVVTASTPPPAAQQIDLSLTKTVSNAKPSLNSDIVYSIIATNANSPAVTATGVAVKDVLPSGVTYVSSTASQGTYSGGVWTIGTLNTAANATLLITARASQVGTVTNVTEVSSADQTDIDSTPNNYSSSRTREDDEAIATITVNQISPPPATVSCSPSSQTVSVNQPVTLSGSGGSGSFAWTATGGSPASGNGSSFQTSYSTSGTKTVQVASGSSDASCTVVVNTTPPPPPSTLACSPSSQTVGVNQAATLTASGGTGTYSWTAALATPASGNGASFSASYSASGSKTVTVTSGSFQSTCSVVVQAVAQTQADLSLTKAASYSNPIVGSQITYIISILNSGPGTANAVTVTDVLPKQVSFVGAFASQGIYDQNTAIWNVGTLATGNSASLQITVKVLKQATIANTAEVTSSSLPDPDSTPNNHNPNEDDQASITVVSRVTPGLPNSGIGTIASFVAGLLALVVGLVIYFAHVRRRRLAAGDIAPSDDLDN